MKKFFDSLSPYKRRYIPIYIIMGIWTLISFILIFTLPVITHDYITDKDKPTKRQTVGFVIGIVAILMVGLL